ncbi:hypothetical protein DRE_04588 [Drechslerella stenobrocha 248]|uniref:Uncharacterized protein n=1 Tax=Drechslerella stenobrocha 248 TaxID=1043628 RepID=W7IAU6_9PEZI|nr:hypothetical protein DRE_04588 [Drechslerella stenobrocha 248]
MPFSWGFGIDRDSRLILPSTLLLLLANSIPGAFANLAARTQARIDIRTATLSPTATWTTAPHASRTTPAPRLANSCSSKQLFARQVNTADPRFCAFANGDGASPLYCAEGYTCTFVGVNQAWGCCNPRGCVNAPRTCINAGEGLSFCTSYPYLDPASCTAIFISAYTSLLSCEEKQPACQTYLLRTATFDPGNIDGVPSFTCGATSTQVFVYLNAITNVGSKATYSNTGASTPNPTAAGGNTNKADDKSNSGTSSDKDNDNNNKGLDTGAIVGAVVGAIGVVVTILVTLFPRQMTRFFTFGLRPKKGYSNHEIRNMAWAYVTGQVAHTHTHMHTHTHVHHVQQPQTASQTNLAQPLPAPTPSPSPAQQWNQPGGYTGYAGYGAQPAPAYQPQGMAHPPPHAYEYPEYGAGYAMPQGYQLREQQRPFLDDSSKQ